MSKLRQKLGDDPRAPRYLRTVRGVGYRLDSEGGGR
jgi:DNA-binding response OmpR family regulator